VPRRRVSSPARQLQHRRPAERKTLRRRLHRPSGPHPRSQRNCHTRHSHGGKI
jgi:hypothetical protein